MKVQDMRIRYALVSKGLVRPSEHNRVHQFPGHAVAVRRVDDRPVTRSIPVVYKRSEY